MKKLSLSLLALLCLALNGQQHLMVLGIAQDAGKPQIGCTKSCCQPGSPTGKVVSLALLDSNYSAWTLYEASPDITEQLRLIPPQYDSIPRNVFLSHAHIGHYTGLMYFGREAMNADSVKVHTGPRMHSFLQSNGPWSQLVDLGNIELIKVAANIDLRDTLSRRSRLPTATILSLFEVPHRDEFSETYGFHISSPRKKLIFIPDIDKWEKWDIDLIALLKDVDYALIDGTFYDGAELPGRDMSEIPHPFVVETMALLEDLPASEKAKVYFIHLNHTNPLWDPNSEASKNVKSKGFNIAREGQIFEL